MAAADDVEVGEWSTPGPSPYTGSPPAPARAPSWQPSPVYAGMRGPAGRNALSALFRRFGAAYRVRTDDLLFAVQERRLEAGTAARVSVENALQDQAAGEAGVWGGTARSVREGAVNVVFIVCDRGDRYLSTGVFGR